MVTFLEEVIAQLKTKHEDISNCTLILPSKRAGGFLKNYLRCSTAHTAFAPKIISIEEFIEELSGLKIVDNTELLFKSYEAYLNASSIVEKEDFESFSSWAVTMLNDFNEMDRYLVDTKPFFSYLVSIKTLERWGVQDHKTELITNYLQFWESLPEFYENIHALLLKDGVGYQGMVYREAATIMEHYKTQHALQPHVFIGFNALNTAEQQIVNELLETGNTDIYLDSDQWFYTDTNHSASYFIRKYIKEWKYFKKNEPNFISNNYEKKKHFQFVEIQKNIGQVKYVGELLSNYSEEQLDKTAIVLGDESLLLPLLYSLPSNVQSLNITMGAPLKMFPAVVFFELLFTIHLRETGSLYYKDILAILNHPLGNKLIPNAAFILQQLSRDNTTHITPSALIELSGKAESHVLKLLFEDWKDSSSKALEVCLQLLTELQNLVQESLIERLVLNQLLTVLKGIETLNEGYPHLKSVKTVMALFTEIVATSSLDFEGDAYSGLQVMGVLETRALDFENLIITSVNEGILPSGKSNASFITYDLKQQFNLPNYTEKDAIYTYHFYRLLHRATNITLLYNNHSEGINTGEKSRFLMQLEIENHPNHQLEKIVVAPKVNLESSELKQINKTPAVIQRLQEIAEKGFSPSALTSYIRNPIDFYFQKILQLRELEEVEETVAANTLGTVVHDTLETFYKPLEGSVLTASHLLEMKKLINEEVSLQFKKTFKGGTISRGKNLIVFEVAKRYILNFLNRQLEEINSANKIKIIKIEADLSLEIPIPKLPFPVKIHGKVDRVEEYNGQLRIIDYKSGMVNQADLEFVDWEDLTQDYKYSKAFQVLAYSLMINKEVEIERAEAGIISFKNLNSGFLKFGIKEKMGGKKKNQIVTQETLSEFREQLVGLITEICDPEIPFTEKEIAS